MIYYQISYLLFGIFIILSLYFIFKHNYIAILTLLIISSGVGGFNIYFGTLWFPYKIICLFIFFLVLFNLNKFFFHNYFKMIIILFIFSLLVAIIFFPSSEPPNLPLFQRKFVRPFLQLFSYASVAAIIPFVLKTLKTQEDFQTIFKNYYLIIEIVMCFAVLQFILIKNGIDFMPIIRPNIGDSGAATFVYDNIRIFRLYGISGEAKTLAAYIFPYFFISLFNFSKANYNRSYFYHILMLIISLFVLINTYSSAILISLVFCMLFSIFIWFKNNLKFIGLLVAFILIMQYVYLGSFSLIRTKTNTTYNVYNIIALRTVTRMQTKADATVDVRAMKYLFEKKPMAMLTGLGLGMYPYYLQLGGRHGIDPIDSTWMSFIMDFGFIGVAVFIYIFLKVFRIRYKKLFTNDVLYNSFLVGLTSSYFIGLGIPAYFYMIFFLAMTLASYRYIIRNNKLQLRAINNYY